MFMVTCKQNTIKFYTEAGGEIKLPYQTFEITHVQVKLFINQVYRITLSKMSMHTCKGSAYAKYTHTVKMI